MVIESSKWYNLTHVAVAYTSQKVLKFMELNFNNLLYFFNDFIVNKMKIF